MKKPIDSETLLKQLLTIKTETQNLDFKRTLNWKQATKRDKLEVVKDVLSMANVQDGGHIVVGVDDKNYEAIGIDNESLISFDITSFNQFLHNYADPTFSCHIHKIGEGKDKKFVIIDIPEFQEVPIIAKQDGHDSDNNQIIKAGQIYYRTEKATCGIMSSAQDMRELLGRALMKRKHDLLHAIESIIQGRPKQSDSEVSDIYKNEIQLARDSLLSHFKAPSEHSNFWELTAYPKNYNPSRMKDQKEIKIFVKKSTVSLRGWDFPITDSPATTFNTQNGIESYFRNADQAEGCQVNKDGFFFWRSHGFKDETDPQHEAKTLCFISAIYQITEIFIFLSRFYNSFDGGGEIAVTLTISGLKDRKLVSSDWRVPGLHHRSYYVAGVDQFNIARSYDTATLAASFKELASEIIQELFLIFNMENMTPEAIASWQDKLIKRTY